MAVLCIISEIKRDRSVAMVIHKLAVTSANY